ncbi:unnamed protein product, partial [Rhizoctonia solani]
IFVAPLLNKPRLLPRLISNAHPLTQMRASTNNQRMDPASPVPALEEIPRGPVLSEHTQQPYLSSAQSAVSDLAAKETNNKWPPMRAQVDDVLEKIPRLFRLVDLIREDGPNGITEKTVIDQGSLQQLLNTIVPGSCPSTAEIHFHDLDKSSIKPLGLYGDRHEIVKFLQRVGCLDTNSAALIIGQDSEKGGPSPLFPGLYLALAPTEPERLARNAYMVYWPEVTTWDDQAASSSVQHNRTSFIRYLTKMTNQIIALPSLSQALTLNWKASVHGRDPSIEQMGDYDSRLSSFKLVGPGNHDDTESIYLRPGFGIIVKSSLIPATSRVRLIPGEHNVGLWVVERSRHSIYPLAMSELDIQSRNGDGAPRVDIQQKFEFSLPRGHSIEFLQLVRNKCLVVISERGKIRIHVEDDFTIDHAINRTHGKRTLYHDSTGGSQCNFAFDEATRLLAIVYGEMDDQKLSTYVFDESFTSLSQNSSISLKDWFSKPTTITKICFIPGFEEICLIDTSGDANVYSLPNQLFRELHPQNRQSALNTLPDPDHPCLLIVAPGEMTSTPRVLRDVQQDSLQKDHLKQGVFVTELSSSDGYRVISRLGTNTIHLVTLSRDSQTITSMILDVRQPGVSLFQFPQTVIPRPCHSLFDCHLHAWTRYPLVAPEGMALLPGRQESKELIIGSPVPLIEAQSYFSVLKSKLKLTAPYISEESLPSLVVLVAIEDELYGQLENRQVSEFNLASYVQELLCLVPLHLVVVRGNQFSFADGVWSSDHNILLSGGDITHITDTLSLGWYEPLFRSHSASKPVRVVSSIGDRGVGKSYSLDHLANTSFGVCGDRHSLGIWLSCTPTDKYLLVALDLKGVHPTEQNNGANTLMGLFSAAISDLVILRGSFTLTYYSSKLVTGLLSLTKLMNPDDSPGLFNSMLAIIIKDVSDPNAYAAVKEFSDHLQKLIEATDDNRVVLSLHRAGIQVIPWPVINTVDFYVMFARLRKQLDQRPPTCHNGSVFSHKLKILMGKIKTRDWAPLDQSLASYWAKKLLGSLPSALRYGQDIKGPLKNMQTDEVLRADAQDHANFKFWVPAFGNGESEDSSMKATVTIAERALSMKGLVDSYAIDPESRQRMQDTDYVDATQKSIYNLLEQRLDFVQRWAMVNTETFPQDNTHIREFLRKLAGAGASMRDATRICASQCNKCKLLCLLVRQHSGEHECGTDHDCMFDCELFEPNERREPCALPAGHEELHMCGAMLHYVIQPYSDCPDTDSLHTENQILLTNHTLVQ